MNHHTTASMNNHATSSCDGRRTAEGPLTSTHHHSVDTGSPSPSMDPFDASMAELRQLMSSSRSLISNASTRGVITAEVVKSLGENVDEAEETLRMLQQVLQHMRDGKLKGTHEAVALVAGTTWLQRETAVVEASNELYDVTHAAKKLTDAFQKQQLLNRQQQGIPGGGIQDPDDTTGDDDNGHDRYLRAHHEEQTTMMSSQDASLDRIHNGLKNLRQNAATIHSELGQQSSMLDEAQSRMDLLKEKMATANVKVDTLLNSMSDCRKICIIIVLCLILGFLAMSVL